jgi:hypothetical protein
MQPMVLAGFWWGSGHGNITPFVEKLFDLIEKYSPIYSGIDATGTQKNMNVIINEHLFKKRFGEYGYVTPTGIVRSIGPMDFSGSMKAAYLNAARLLIESVNMRWPKGITAIRSQATNYDLEKDKKIPQDIVATLETLLSRNASQPLREHTPFRRKPVVARNRRNKPRKTEKMYSEKQ